MSDISPETTSSSGSRRRRIFPENLSRSSTSQQQGYERANMAPSPSAVDGRAAITQGCASARNELNKRAPQWSLGTRPTARERVVQPRSGHDARAAATQRGAYHTRAAAVPRAVAVAAARCQPPRAPPRPPARARARRPMAGAGEPAPYARVPARRPGRDVLSPRWLVTRAERRDGEHTIMDFTRQFSPFTPLFFCLVSRRITMGHRFDQEFCFYVSFFVYFCRDIFFLRITMGA